LASAGAGDSVGGFGEPLRCFGSVQRLPVECRGVEVEPPCGFAHVGGDDRFVSLMLGHHPQDDSLGTGVTGSRSLAEPLPHTAVRIDRNGAMGAHANETMPAPICVVTGRKPFVLAAVTRSGWKEVG